MPVPRWSKTYGRDYLIFGNVQHAEPVTDLLAPYLAWSAAHVDARQNAPASQCTTASVSIASERIVTPKSN